jgi:amino acid transporter
MWIPVLIIIGLGLLAYHRFGSANSFSFHSMTPSLRLNDIIFWSVLAFAFGGCETGSFMAEEIKNPRRIIPLALFVGGLTIAFCYIVGTVCVLLALPSSEVSPLQGLVQAIAKTSERVGLLWFLPIAAFLIALSNIGSSGAYLAAVARLPFVAGVDHYLPASFGKLHPRWGTPWVALLTQAVIGAIFIFLGQAGTSVQGAYEVLISMSVISYFIPYLYLFASMFKLQGEPAGEEIIRVPGGRPAAYVLAVVGFAATLLTIALSVLPPPDEPNKALAVCKVVGGCGALVLVGVGLYSAGKRRALRDQAF